MEIKGLHGQPGAGHPGRRRRRRSTTSPSCSTAPTAQYLCIASVEGGVEIEEVAKTNPDAVKQIADRPRHRRRRGEGPRDRRPRPTFPEPVFETGRRRWSQALWKVFVEEDATLVEVNPLARLAGDKLEALDGKVSLDENAEFRHADHAQFEIKEEADPLEAKAKDKGLNYVKLDGAGRHHRQRRGAGHVDPRRRRVRR